jgi:hypothetical protein
VIQVVNGYLCMTGCDVAAARRGEDPRNPTGDPAKQALIDRAHPAEAGGPGRRAVAGQDGRVDPATSVRDGAVRNGAARGGPASGATAAGVGRTVDIVV